MADLNKLVDDLSALTILEASELKSLLEAKWGVTAASGGGMMMMLENGWSEPKAVESWCEGLSSHLELSQ